MLKYYNSMITFSEVPDEISLCINISNCPIKCPDCHSKFLWENIGKEITDECLEKIINENNDVTCICIMGGDSDIKDILRIVTFIKNKFPSKKICWYSGKDIQINNISLPHPSHQKQIHSTLPHKVHPEELGGKQNLHAS